LKIHPRDQQHNIYLLEKAKRLYEEFLGDNRHIIAAEVARFEAVLETQDPIVIHRAQQQFSEFLNRFDGGWLL